MYGFEKDEDRTDGYGTSAWGRKGWQDPFTGAFYEDKNSDEYKERMKRKEEFWHGKKDESAPASFDSGRTFTPIPYESEPDYGEIASKAAGGVFTAAAGITMAASLAKNPDDVAGAGLKALRNGVCAVCILVLLFGLVVIALMYYLTEENLRHYFVTTGIVFSVIDICCIIGFIRVIAGRNFFFFIRKKK